MNLSDLEYACKKHCRKVFDAAKDSFINHPFVGDIDKEQLAKSCIEFEISQVFKSKINNDFKDFLNTPRYYNIIQERAQYYERLAIKTFKNFVANQA